MNGSISVNRIRANDFRLVSGQIEDDDSVDTPCTGKMHPSASRQFTSPLALRS